MRWEWRDGVDVDLVDFLVEALCDPYYAIEGCLEELSGIRVGDGIASRAR